MHRAKLLSLIFAIVSLILICIACVSAGYFYAQAECAILHAGYSAPAYISLIYVIPYIPFIAVSIILTVIFNKKS